MATTSPDNIYSPDSGNQYALVQDLGAMADSVQSALATRGNSYRGTSAQRTAFTSQAPQGTLWSDTNGSQLVYVRKGTGWEEVNQDPEDSGWQNLLGNIGSGTARWRRYGESVEVEVSGATVSGVVNLSPTLPLAERPSVQRRSFIFSGSNAIGTILVLPSGQVQLIRVSSGDQSNVEGSIQYMLG